MGANIDSLCPLFEGKPNIESLCQLFEGKPNIESLCQLFEWKPNIASLPVIDVFFIQNDYYIATFDSTTLISRVSRQE